MEEEENDTKAQYVKLVWKDPNPLFVKWISEWLEEAKKRNMQLHWNLEKALESLKKFPIPLKSGKDCLILEHFGKGLCNKLDSELAKYKAKIQAKEEAIPGPSNGVPGPVNAIPGPSKVIPGPSNDVPRPVNAIPGPSNVNQGPLKDLPRPVFAIAGPSNVKPGQPKLLNKSVRINCVPEQNDDNQRPKTFTQIGLLGPNNQTDKPCISTFDTNANEPIDYMKKYLQVQKEIQRALEDSSPENLLKIEKPSPTKRLENGTLIPTNKLFVDDKPLPKVTIVEDNTGPKRIVYLEWRPSPKKIFVDDKPSPKKIFVDDKPSPKKQFEVNNPGKSRAEPARSPAKRKFNEESPGKKKQKRRISPIPMEDENYDAPLSQLSSAGSSSQTQTQEEAFIFVPGDVRIKLLVDTAETSGNMGKRSRGVAEATAYLTELGVPFEVRHLPVGDFVWVLQDGVSRELLLPYIVERKRADDLAKSIKDGRFREQKFRLKQLPVAERIYLVEELKGKDRKGLPLSTLMQAVTNTQVIDGFKVKFTNNLKHSMQFLSVMTDFLTKNFDDKIMMSCPKDELPPFDIKDDVVRLMTFKDFSRDSAKKRKYTVGEMFLKHLLQLRGMSVEKAKAVVDVYPTPTHLMEAYRDYNGCGQLMLAKLKIGALGRYLGPVLSTTIHDFYTNNQFD
ncbi:crossover junction endonuclease MUS81 isoform X2 [Nilaparvata lugens]|uniref:crossover junction endonuclease MUS81 isoform X1 n=1 Tax=Nilaparvata lugens TaxID=108931 RepID=UPI00193E4554|nr:crossover junction endonuclease MUS81 isoform X1 [Nilaparvata lugens]XP_039287732.1 crossover junction endonuclease MUS81 isoform X1 [Nilaparvata lugens]XP_039287733.1 crossover junction endonuclease MUS81 isoform X1 [Nilaparvata lugens]XP_039287734.1 crossover junction endonuclease MUS81 isoform X1 [Nilaparvata lugens]XP_039287735.1 crossover junction endonuclease MUS81 isoform X2 [Nilaparvata lugens]